jgi:hypothetical protein
VSTDVVVDLDSAVVAYRPAANEELSVSAKRSIPAALFDAAPWRTFRWYRGQRHYSGTYWSATECRHVIYESRLELEALLIADFDATVRRIVAQPFRLRAEVNGRLHEHTLDFLLAQDDAPLVIDVVRAERLAQPKVQFKCAWTRQIIQSLGWSYVVSSEQDPVWIGNVRFLAGYRRDWLVNRGAVDELRARAEGLVGKAISEAESQITSHPQPLVRSALFHLLWRHEFSVDLTQPLSCSTVLEVGK